MSPLDGPPPVALHPTAIEALLEELSALLPERPAGVAFDADGTLWSGDVGEDMFRYAVEHGLLKRQTLQALNELADKFGLKKTPEANAQAQELFEAYERGTLPELEVCELMAWCYAGYTADELRPHIRDALAGAHLEDRYYAPTRQAIEWARGHKLRTIVISASPWMVVVEAVRSLGFSPADVRAGHPSVLRDEWQTTLQYPLPYAATKVSASRSVLNDTPLLAAFGDNVFDFELLATAIVQVAVRPKPALRERLSELAHCRLLS